MDWNDDVHLSVTFHQPWLITFPFKFWNFLWLCGKKTLTLAITFEPLEIETSTNETLSNNTKGNDLVILTVTFLLSIANFGFCCCRGHSCFTNTPFSLKTNVRRAIVDYARRRRPHIFASQGSDPLPSSPGKRIGALASEDGVRIKTLTLPITHELL